ncbi:MAG: MBL fold metallo-hydrolase [Actinobacteria bacterium]|nr:MAG: MBL fold metallo-hydrolase [Actinomycetota bacterium]
MRVTVLGSAASYAGPGQACAGCLVQGASAAVLLDCGHGVLANLQRVADPLALDAVVISHAHPDHFVDLYALHTMLRYAPQGPAGSLRLHAPAGLIDRMGALLSERGRASLAEAFDERGLVAGAPLAFDDLTVTAFPVDHMEGSFALTVECAGRLVCYTGDTAPGAAILAAARGCDLLIAEATLPERYAGRAPHLSAREAGALAREAGAAALALVHIWPANDREEILRDAEAEFPGPVSLPSEMDSFDL